MERNESDENGWRMITGTTSGSSSNSVMMESLGVPHAGELEAAKSPSGRGRAEYKSVAAVKVNLCKSQRKIKDLGPRHVIMFSWVRSLTGESHSRQAGPDRRELTKLICVFGNKFSEGRTIRKTSEDLAALSGVTSLARNLRKTRDKFGISIPLEIELCFKTSDYGKILVKITSEFQRNILGCQLFGFKTEDFKEGTANNLTTEINKFSSFNNLTFPDLHENVKQLSIMNKKSLKNVIKPVVTDAARNKRRNNSSAGRSCALNGTKRTKDEISTEDEEELLRDPEETLPEDRTNITPSTSMASMTSDMEASTEYNSGCGGLMATTSSPRIKEEPFDLIDVSVIVRDDEIHRLNNMVGNLSVHQTEQHDDVPERGNLALPAQKMNKEEENVAVGVLDTQVHTNTSKPNETLSRLSSDVRFRPYSGLSSHNRQPSRSFYGKSRGNQKLCFSPILCLKTCNTFFQGVIMQQQRSDAPVTCASEHKVSIWLQGYPQEASIINDSIKDIILVNINDAMSVLEQRLKARGIRFTPVLFPLVVLQHQQLVIGCQNEPGVQFVITLLGNDTDHSALGIGKKILVARTLDNTSIRDTYLVTVPGEVSWDVLISTSRDRLSLPATDTWIKVKVVKFVKKMAQQARGSSSLCRIIWISRPSFYLALTRNKQCILLRKGEPGPLDTN